MVIFREGYRVLSTTPRILVASENTARLSIRYFNKYTNQSIIIDKSNTEYGLSKSVFPSDWMHLAGIELHSDVRINLYGFAEQSPKDIWQYL